MRETASIGDPHHGCGCWNRTNWLRVWLRRRGVSKTCGLPGDETSRVRVTAGRAEKVERLSVEAVGVFFLTREVPLPVRLRPGRRGGWIRTNMLVRVGLLRRGALKRVWWW